MKMLKMHIKFAWLVVKLRLTVFRHGVNSTQASKVAMKLFLYGLVLDLAKRARTQKGDE